MREREKFNIYNMHFKIYLLIYIICRKFGSSSSMIPSYMFNTDSFNLIPWRLSPRMVLNETVRYDNS